MNIVFPLQRKKSLKKIVNYNFNKTPYNKNIKYIKNACNVRQIDISSLSNDIPVIIQAFDETLTYNYWNKESENVTGYTFKEMVGVRNAWRRLYPNVEVDDSNKFAKQNFIGNFRNRIMAIICADGSYKTIAWTNISEKKPIPGWKYWIFGFDVTDIISLQSSQYDTSNIFKNVLQTLPEGILIHKDGKCIYMNKYVIDLLSATSESKFINKQVQDLFEVTSSCFYPGNNYKNNENYLGQNECYCKRCNKYLKFSSINTDLHGLGAILTIIKDITERKNNENKLIHSKNITRALIDSTDDDLILIDSSYNIVACNKSWSKKQGLHPKFVVGKNLLEIMPEILNVKVQEAVKNVTKSKKQCMFVEQIQDKIFDFRIYPIIESKSKITKFVLNIHDITAIEIIERTQQETKMIYKTIFDRVGDIVFIHDFRGKIVKANKSLADLLGYRMERVEQLFVKDIFVIDSSSENFVVSESNSESCILRSTLINKNQKQVPIDIRVCSIKYDGEPALLCVGRDVTVRERATKILLQAKIEAEKNIQIKNEFLANISHELRTPLSSIIGLAQIISMGNLEINQREYLKRIQTSADHLLSLINDLLDLSKLNSGVYSLEVGEFKIQDIISELLASNIQHVNDNIHFDVDIDNNIPAFLLGDSLRLKQILYNLINNAFKFTNEGTITLSVKLLEMKKNNNLVLKFSVKDTGVGIPTEDISKIFERFSQGSNAQLNVSGGVGLGLAISKQLSELMGGNIGVESEFGKGSTFHFTLPFDYIQSKQNDNIEICKEYKLDRHMSLLVVEDNVINRDMLKDMLELEGHTVQTASDGFAALDILDYFCPNAILMDLQMPKCDGIETTKHIRKHADSKISNIPIIAITAFSNCEYKELCQQAGIDDFLLKPLFLEDLRNIIAKIASGSLRKHSLQEFSTSYSDKHIINFNLLETNLYNDDNLIKLACNNFVKHSIEFEKQLNSALENNHFHVITRLAHSFKSITSLFGASVAQQLTNKLEEYAKLNDLKNVSISAVLLVAEINKIREIVKTRC